MATFYRKSEIPEHLHRFFCPAEIGLETSLAEYLAAMVDVFREVRRVLRPDGTLWLNIGDSYSSKPPGNVCGVSERTGLNGAADPNGRYRETLIAGHATKRDTTNAGDGIKPKDLMMVPARLAIALQDDGWWLRSDIIWHKRAPMPESVTDRPTSAHEHVFLLAKRPRYYYDADAVREESEYDGPPKPGAQAAITSLGGKDTMRLGVGNPAGRNLRNVWTLGPEPFPEAHFATFVSEIPRRAIKAGTSERGVCADCGAPWVRQVERTPMVLARSERGTQMGEFGRTQTSGTMVQAPSSRTTGWSASCGCGAVQCLSCDTVLEYVHDKAQTSTRITVSDMRQDVPPVEAGADVLLAGVLPHEGQDADGTGVRTLRPDVPAQNGRQSLLWEGMCERGHGGESSEHQGLHSGPEGLHPAPASGASDGERRGIRDGASAGDGGAPGAHALAGRSGPPQERDQGRQPDREPGVVGEAGARRHSQAEVSGDVPVLRPYVPCEGQCPRCGGGLVVGPPPPQPALVLDPFLGSGTTMLVADQLGRACVGIELNPEYAAMAERRVRNDAPLLAGLEVAS